MSVDDIITHGGSCVRNQNTGTEMKSAKFPGSDDGNKDPEKARSGSVLMIGIAMKFKAILARIFQLGLSFL